MASSNYIHKFHSEWSSTVASFLRLYLGDRDQGNALAVDVFCEYMAMGLPLDTKDMPIGLWECAVDVATCAEDEALYGSDIRVRIGDPPSTFKSTPHISAALTVYPANLVDCVDHRIAGCGGRGA